MLGAAHPSGSGVGGGVGGGLDASSFSVGGALLGLRNSQRKGRQQVYGIAYRQYEQYIIARYGTCANGRLMGSLAAAVRAGRLQRDGKLYLPTGITLTPVVQSQVVKLSDTQRSESLAEEKRNRKLAKQLLFTGKARRRQEMENARVIHNSKLKVAVSISDRRRTVFLRGQLEVLRPFIVGAKRSLQLALGLEVLADNGVVEDEDEPAEAEDGFELITCEVCGRLFQHVGAMKSHRKACTGEILFNAAGTSHSPNEKGSSSDAAPLFTESQVFGVMPDGDLGADAIADMDWLEATLQPHQIVGVNWLLRAYSNGINGILADEMGLGKTIQTIAFLGILKFVCGVVGPSLIVAPLSVLTTWVHEFKRFAPALRVVRLHSADREERELMRTELLSDVNNFDVVVTTYEMAASQNMKTILCHRIHWRYLVLDEGHRIKNEKTNLYDRLRMVKAQRKLLLTGTPLQNNLHELWALLHFLHPELFSDSQVFDDAFNLSKGHIDESVITKCGQLLNAFMIRRLKRDVLATLPHKTEALVYVPMSRTQVELSRQLLVSGAQVLARLASTTEEGRDDATGAANKDWLQMQSLLLSLRKCCNHPQLFGSWMAEVSAKVGEDLAAASGKLATLDRMLKRLLPRGHRIVLFSGWTSMLDIIEEFFKERDIVYARLDGSTNRVQRQIDIKQFNAKDSRISVFLCSTRAGGLGITLTSADTVVLYDSDFNPQVDLQAMDRVHRIGQTKPVVVYRLVTHGTVEERIVQRARDKIYLMQATMKAGAEEQNNPRAEEQQSMPGGKVSRAEMMSVLQFGVAGALAAQNEGAIAVSQELVDSVILEVEGAVKQGMAATSVGVGGRKATEKAGAFSAERAAQAAAALGGDEGGPSEEHVDVHKAVEVLGRGSRDRQSRFFQVGGDLVLKINNYTLEEGEKSVFDSELDGRQDRTTAKRAHRSQAGKDYENCSQCQLCWKQGEVLCCDYCPTVMHPHCAGIEDVTELGSMWSCPHHKCTFCGRKAHAAGGLLFRCTECPKAFCEDHLPLEADLLGGEVDRLVKLGFGAVKQACYVHCSADCKSLRESRDEEEELQAGMEGDEEDGEEEGEEEDADEPVDDELAPEQTVESVEAPPKLTKSMAAELAGNKATDKGSWYAVTVVGLSGGSATVRHELLRDDEGDRVKETVPLKLVRPAPPPCPSNWLENVREGAYVEFFYLDGWWEVKLLKRLPAKGDKPERFKVVAERYNAQHTALGSQLRPGWLWKPGSKTWMTRR